MLSWVERLLQVRDERTRRDREIAPRLLEILPRESRRQACDIGTSAQERPAPLGLPYSATMLIHWYDQSGTILLYTEPRPDPSPRRVPGNDRDAH
jgi:hypothetical protein